MQIGELARQGGVSIQTVRYYERLGLLKRPERKPSRYRVYAEDDGHRLQFILHAKTLGFTLDEIKHILDLREKQTCPCGEVRRIGEERLLQLDAQIAELTTFRNQLAGAVSQWKKAPDTAPSGDAICVLIERSMAQVQSVSSTPERSNFKWHSSKAKSINARTRNAGVKSR
jgi:DNA-binding transcriptional MerR regulator